MKVSVVYAETERQSWIPVKLAAGETVADAIHKSGILERFPAIDLCTQKVGIFGKLAKLEASLSEGDRVEIYMPIIADPKTVSRRPLEE
tara:strand:+ start:4201 stop:4467 length:267 start_codon:yes stop_codon:yes gene_type:complete